MTITPLANLTLSVLDLAAILAGHTAADTFRNTVDLARHAEQWGYRRYWLAEHHNMASIASSATSILIGHVAGNTTSIRVGSGGIMLPNHAPLVIAEQFGTLASLYPGRIDLGLGRAPGTDQLTALALRRDQHTAANDFPQNVQELQTYLSAENRGSRVRAVPGEGLDIPIWLLGSSTYSAQLAAMLGLPFAFASHFAPTYLHEALRLYRHNFRPSAQLQEAYAMACVNVIAADTDEEAERLATSFYVFALGIIRGTTLPLQPPLDSMDGYWTDYEEAAVRQMMTYVFIGGPETIARKLEAFRAQTQVQELMVVSHIYDPAARLRSYEILAELAGTAQQAVKVEVVPNHV
ncbi:luciferase family oxidoreductase group 1 [Hymenobacter luteus]|uniref:Luciferase-like monooxygenase n=2 Tax=Hymenobacter TaxID=89966 RepID=A0A7W9T0E9_9BACT|nr:MULTISPECIES: LLM class flavin-dependent oxidoreductase [Hymenobacter]MBB4602290.1 luciferase family oxidoreductase group 1 [Hymenobacter latericoloratus]MBB6059281.1 luciferase family oxidoreductase group 1 [Hymenobacter luteus]